MLTKIFGLILCVCLIPTLAQTQKIKDKGIYIKYVQLPKKKLPEDYKTYSVKATGNTLQLAGESSVDFSKQFTMDGFRRVHGETLRGGHLRITIDCGNIISGEPELESGTRTRKDKDGNEYSETYHFYKVPMNSSYSYSILNREGEVLATASYPNDKYFDSDRYSQISSLTKNRAAIINEMQRKYAKEVLQDVERSVKAAIKPYDFDNYRDFEELYIIRAHSSEGQFEKHYDRVKEIFDKADQFTSSEDLAAQLEASMDFYRQYAEQSHRNNKKLKRIYRAGNYNLALLYFATDQFDKAIEHAQKVIESEGKDGKSKRLIQKIEDMKERMVLHGVETIHYRRDLEEEEAETGDRVFKSTISDKKEETIDGLKKAEGSIFMGAKEIFGYYTIEEDSELEFGTHGNVKFYQLKSGMEVELDLTDPLVQRFKIGERKFGKILFAPSAKGLQAKQMQIMESIYSSDKIKLFKYYPEMNSMSEEKSEFAFQKRNEETPQSLEGTQFLLWNKGLGKYFSDCEDLKSLCEEGRIKKTQEDLIKAARIYSELCN